MFSVWLFLISAHIWHSDLLLLAWHTPFLRQADTRYMHTCWIDIFNCRNVNNDDRKIHIVLWSLALNNLRRNKNYLISFLLVNRNEKKKYVRNSHHTKSFIVWPSSARRFSFFVCFRRFGFSISTAATAFCGRYAGTQCIRYTLSPSLLTLIFISRLYSASLCCTALAMSEKKCGVFPSTVV